MPTYKRPGAYVNEVLTSTNPQTPDSGSTVAAFLGPNAQGPTSASLIQSYSDFLRQYGNLNANYKLGFAVFSYFSNGGKNAYIVRVTGSGAAGATRVLNDRATTPLPTLEVDAINPGAWGNNVYIDITDGATGRFNLVVKFGGSADSNTVETFTDLSMTSTDSRYAPTVINGVSNYISVVDKSSTSASPNNNPSVQAGSVLSGGADGAAPASTDYQTSLSALDQYQGPIVLNLPGVSDTTNLNNAISYAENRGDVFVVIDPPVGDTPAQVVTATAALNQSSYGAVYYPNLVISDPLTTTPGSTRTIAPGGAVIGKYVTTDASRGVQKAPAGLETRLAGVVALERTLTPTDLDTLNTALPPINAIRQVPGAGVVIMGARTLKTGYVDKYVPTRRTLIYLRRSLINLTQFAIFEPNDEILWGQIRATVAAFLTTFWQQGGLRGTTPDDAFYVKCDASNNTTATIQNGQVNVEVGVALEFPAEFVVITLGQFDGGTSVNEL